MDKMALGCVRVKKTELEGIQEIITWGSTPLEQVVRKGLWRSGLEVRSKYRAHEHLGGSHVPSRNQSINRKGYISLVNDRERNAR